MNASTDTTEELVHFICDELQRDPSECVANNARVLREYCTQASYLMDKNVLVIWMRERWSYTGVTGKRTLAAIAEVAGEYASAILGDSRPVRVIIGRVNCYRRKR